MHVPLAYRWEEDGALHPPEPYKITFAHNVSALSFFPVTPWVITKYLLYSGLSNSPIDFSQPRELV